MVLSIKHGAKRNVHAEPKELKQQLVDMPLDVLIEIFFLSEPLDLLHLSRTTKVLRAFLLSRKKSSTLWKNAISNIKDLPPCPDHMSAPAYTHLAFVPVCHGCFCPCETVEWELRMRCCLNCFPEMTIPRSIALRNTRPRYLNDLTLPIATGHYRLDDNNLDLRIRVTLEAVSPAFSLSDWRIAKSRKLRRKVSATEFLAEQNDFWGSIRKHAHLCRYWELGRLKEKAAELSLVRTQRVDYIKDGLLKLGWMEVVTSIYCHKRLLQLPQVRKLEPLTPTEWAEICPQLVSWAQGVQSDLVWDHFMTTFNSVYLCIRQELESVASDSLKALPREADIAMLPAVPLMLQSDIMSHDNLRRKLFHVLRPAVRKWSSDAVEELEQFAREQLGLQPLSKPSCLPSVVFRCNSCSSPRRLRFDEALSHQHLYDEKRKETQRENTREMTPYDKFVMEYAGNACPRSIKALRVDVTVSRRVENLIRRMGQNPNRVTYNELRHSTVKLVCGLCRLPVATRMDFEHAFQHCLNAHLWKKETEVWTRVSARDSK